MVIRVLFYERVFAKYKKKTIVKMKSDQKGEK